MRPVAFALAAGALAAACSTNGPIPAPPTSPDAVRSHALERGVYVSEFQGGEILGYRIGERRKSGPSCTVDGASSVSGIAVDAHGNLIEPNGGTAKIDVFRGPQMCGDLAGSFKDPDGYPTDAASADAMTGRIAIANIADFGNASGGKPGSVSICKLAGCTKHLTSANMYTVVGVAMDGSGNCFASASTASGKASLVYFKACAGRGKAAAGYLNVSPGGLDFDKNGNLISLDAYYGATGRLIVYRGCKPTCVVAGGPFVLRGNSVYGHLTANGEFFYAANVIAGEIDVYRYGVTKLTHEYSFGKGLSKSELVIGVAVNPGLAR